VDLDAVFRLAEERKPRSAGREKVTRARSSGPGRNGWAAQGDGPAYGTPHEGGIQNEDGTLTRSSFGALIRRRSAHRFDVLRATFIASTPSGKHWQHRAT